MSNRKPCAAEIIEPKIDGSLSPNDVLNVMYSAYGSNVNQSSGRGPVVVFTPHGWDALCASVNYGKSVPENELESQYFLEGYYFVSKKGVSTTVITNVITPYSASQNKASAALYSPDKFNAYTIVEQKEKELQKFACAGKDVIHGTIINAFYKGYGSPHRVGFGHTHPGLGVFFSSTDKTSVFAAAGEPWITMVIDPRKCEILVAVGANLTTAHLYIFEHEKVTEKKDLDEHIDATAEIEKIEFDQLGKIIDAALKQGCSITFDISGKLPGKVKFKGSFHCPKTKSSKRRSNAKR